VRRLRLILLVILGLVVFLGISAVLARILSLDGAERTAIAGLLQSQARGDAGGMRRQLHGCGESPGCRQRAAENALRLRRTGSVKILELGSSAGFSLTSTIGTARVAWRAGNALPVVQCVRVRRAGNAISGFHIELLEISRRIKSDASCPARY
jgi:hypothetical protein